MIVYAQLVGDKITTLSTEDSPGSTKLDVTPEEMMFFHTHTKRLVDGKIVNEEKLHTPSKEELVSLIKVTISTGKVFDGNEPSQDRMVRAISIASISGKTGVQWKLADNTIVIVTLDELKEALTLAGQEMSRIWL